MKFATPCLAIILFFSACADDSKRNLAYFKMSEEVLDKSNELISSQNHSLSQALDNQVGDIRNSDDIKVWQPKAKKIEILSLGVYTYIDRIISDFNREGKRGNVKEIFFSKGKELYEKLKKYKEDILLVSPEIADNLKGRFTVFGNEIENIKNTPEDFSKTFFNQTNEIAATNTLHMFENNIRILENNLLTYCLNRTMTRISCGSYERFHPLVTLSSNCIKAGDDLEITAGIGAFSYQSVPRFKINGKNILLNQTAIAIYKFKVPVKAGKYVVPVKMEYTKPDGTEESMEKNIEYIVINPNQNP